MMAVMLSIKPKWCEMIANGKKTVECRKDMPSAMKGQNPEPMKVYMYCTKARVISWRNPKTGERMDGKVVGEFICDNVYYAKRFSMGVPVYYKKILEEACLTERYVDAYGKGGDVYGWHITDVKIYDQPIAISDFCLSHAPQSWRYVEDRGEWKE